MKTLVNVGNGALIITEEGGNFTFSVTEQVSVGGGAAAGVISAQGAGSIVLHGKQAFDLAMKLIEAHAPAALVPILEGVKNLADAAIPQA